MKALDLGEYSSLVNLLYWSYIAEICVSSISVPLYSEFFHKREILYCKTMPLPTIKKME